MWKLTGDSRRAGRLGALPTAVTAVVALLAAVISVVVFASDRKAPDTVPVAWLFSSPSGELGRINGGTASVDTRVDVDGSAGHRVTVEQTDRYLVIRDVDTGRTSTLDLVTLQISAYLDTAPGEGVEVLVHERTAYVVDRVRGRVSPVDPQTLAPAGPVLELPPGLRGGGFDTEGRLWLALPGDGTVVAVTPNASRGAPPAMSTVPVTGPGHDLTVSVLDKGIAVLDHTAGQLVTVRGDQVKQTALQLSGPAEVPPHTSGDRVVVTVPTDRTLVVVDGNGAAASFPVPGKGTDLRAAVPWQGRFYVADDAAGVVYVLGPTGTPTGQIAVRGSNHIEMSVRGNYLYINAVDGAGAQVVDREHKVSAVDKYRDDVAGDDTPPPSPAPSTSASGSARPSTSGPPRSSAPPSVRPPSTAPPSVRPPSTSPPAPPRSSAPPTPSAPSVVDPPSSGPSRSGAPPSTSPPSSVAPPSPVRPPSGPRSSMGLPSAGSPSASAPPTNRVPTAVTAQPLPDGTVRVGWAAPVEPAAGYRVGAIRASGPQLTWRSDGTQTALTVPAGALTYGDQVVFVVTALDAQGGSSPASQPSAPVTPFTRPGVPLNLRVKAVADAVQVMWDPPGNANGRPVTRYVIAFDGGFREVTDGTTTRLAALPTGTAVTVVAYNEAGAGEPTAPVTVVTPAEPTVTITGQTPGYTFVTVTFTVDGGGGGTPLCGLAIAGMSRVVEADCTGQSLTYDGLAPGVTYNATLTVTNTQGRRKETPVPVTTKELLGTVACKGTDGYCDRGVGIYSQPVQDTTVRTGRTGMDGQRYRAVCRVVGRDGNLSADAELFAAQYNANKRSDLWIRITVEGADLYIPYVWFNLDDNDNRANLPDCP